MIDALAFHEWPSTATLADYLDSGWREIVMRPGDRGGPIQVRSQWLYRNPLGAKQADAWPAEGVPGSDLATLRAQLLDHEGAERVVLGYEEGLLAMGVSHYHLARAVGRAANQWTIAEWLERDERLHGLVLICSAVPEDAAADVREYGRHERMVGVAMGVNGLGRPFGHAAYLPIYEAAAELDLPIVLQIGSDGVSALDSTPVAGGLPATYGEYAAWGVQALTGHIGSMITQGLFDRFPNLRVMVAGGGATWVAAYLWRLDFWFKTNSKEVPWLLRPPSEVFLERVRLGTLSLESPRQPERLATALGTVAGFDELLMYTSGYPSSIAEPPAAIRARLPEGWHERVFGANADEFFRWPGRARRAGAGPDAGAATATAAAQTTSEKGA
ncbi:amidohydrolase family protein [Conexibacter sp. CPCC 206217]|uniref:amidohydrolase family protein n=1 Tax=Conexibacter sp. CPCC 206217 TaxID=3064574 RepID=UPI0027209C73|nr:amidohydrolase family protein [Conexibacter sp. CPCC 206217]MDO8208892.1 amidohydrolase family protein [Conexibacter sp. CPCC 206217]